MASRKGHEALHFLPGEHGVELIHRRRIRHRHKVAGIFLSLRLQYKILFSFFFFLVRHTADPAGTVYYPLPNLVHL